MLLQKISGHPLLEHTSAHQFLPLWSVLSSNLDLHQSPLSLALQHHHCSHPTSPAPTLKVGWSTGNLFLFHSSSLSFFLPLSPPLSFRSGEHQRLLGLTPGAPCKATSPVPPANINPPNGAAPLPERPPSRTSCAHRTDTRVCMHPTRLLTGCSHLVLAPHTVNNKLSTGLKCARRLMWPMEQRSACAGGCADRGVPSREGWADKPDSVGVPEVGWLDF